MTAGRGRIEFSSDGWAEVLQEAARRRQMHRESDSRLVDERGFDLASRHRADVVGVAGEFAIASVTGGTLAPWADGDHGDGGVDVDLGDGWTLEVKASRTLSAHYGLPAWQEMSAAIGVLVVCPRPRLVLVRGWLRREDFLVRAFVATYPGRTQATRIYPCERASCSICGGRVAPALRPLADLLRIVDGAA
jgi:hypothetical protein